MTRLATLTGWVDAGALKVYSDCIMILPRQWIIEGLETLYKELKNDRYLTMSSNESFLEALKISNFLIKLNKD